MAKIFVEDLAAYNAGLSFGRWIEIDTDPDVMLEEINETILNAGTDAMGDTGNPHEEYAIHDIDGFGPIQVHEYAPLDVIAGYAQWLGTEHERAYFAYVECFYSDGEGFDPDMMHGPFDSMDNYARGYADEVIPNSILEMIGHLIDYDRWGDEILASGSWGEYDNEWWELLD